MKKTIKALLSAFAAMLLVAPAYAQVTTSSMNGKIVDQAGAPVPGAVVLAVHDPSGTQYYSVTNAEGRYYINGMRPGGPYSVEVSCLGFATAKYSNLTLQLAEALSFDTKLSDDAEALSEAVVIADAASKFSAEKTGAATNISSAQITSLPTVSRNITDVTRLSPYGGNGMSFAGVDGRTANFTVDGADFNNNFGLNDKLPGGGSPISIDAIEEVQVVISPFDVRQTNFIGGGVNAITKSGTNTFKASAYVYHRNENMRGDAVAGQQITGARDKDRNTTYGASVGGPIVKNKLFFFANFEYSKIPTVVNRWRGSEDGVADATNYISRTTLADLKTVSDYVKSRYGYDTGSWTDFPADESNMKILARIDWNINDANHLAVRYNYTLNKAWNPTNGTSMDPKLAGRYSSNRMSAGSMAFANSMYSQDNLVHSVSLDVNSRISDKVSNQFLATFSKLDDVRGSTSDEFPFIDISKDGDNYMALGYELFTLHNGVHNNIINAKDDITIYAGSHKITAGASYEYQMADNAYIRNGTGYYRYDSLDDFLNGATPNVVCLTYGYNGETAPAARVQFHKAGIYAQDEWSATDKFKLTYGLRLDGLFFDNKDLMTNNAVKALDYDGRHIDTGKWPTANVTVSPRIGFVYDVYGDKTLKLRGGTGLFSGRLPLVFFTNMPTNSGMIQNQVQLYAGNAAGYGFTMDEFAGGLVTDAQGKATTAALLEKLAGLGFPTTIDPSKGVVPASVPAVDPKFKMPQVWKTSFAVDYVFPTSFPFSVTAEGIFNKTINGVCLTDWSIPSVDGFARFNGVDNRPIYPSGFRTNIPAYILTNTSKGYGWSANLTFNMSPVQGLDLMLAYTHTASKEITGMPGSDASSAFNGIASVDGPNYIQLHNSQYVTPDRLVLAATHHDKSGNHYSLIYETWRGGYNYTYLMDGDMNGDGDKNNDPIYIPTDKDVAEGQFRFVSQDDRDRFMDYVHNNPYLSKHQGQYAEAYSVYSPWVHRLDFSYKHDFKLHVAEKNTHILQLCVDIKNLLNLFNSNWGVAKVMNPVCVDGNGTGNPRILKYEGVDAEGYATFSTRSGVDGTTQTFVPLHDLGQCWYASIGLRYMFN